MIGSGPPLVLVHGLGSSHRVWATIRAQLAEHFTTYAIDMTGHGQSTMPAGTTLLTPQDLAAAVEQWMDSLAIPQAHLVGNSLGGWVILELAAQHRALSVTALCPAGIWKPISKRSLTIDQGRLLTRLAKPLLPLLMANERIRTFGYRNIVSRPEILATKTALEAAQDNADSIGYHAAHQGLLGGRFDRADDIPDDVPITIAFGDEDRVVPEANGRERALVPLRTHWVILDRCGHAPMWDVPDTSVALIRRTAGV